MSTKSLNSESVSKMSMIELANLIMLEERKEMSFKTTFEKVATLKQWDEEEKKAKISQFYTDLNADGRFVTQGTNTWGLKKWYRKGKSGELVADESQAIERKQPAADTEDEDIPYNSKLGDLTIDDVDESIDESIDDFKDDDYYDEELVEGLDDDFDEEFGEDEDEY